MYLFILLVESYIQHSGVATRAEFHIKMSANLSPSILFGVKQIIIVLI